MIEFLISWCVRLQPALCPRDWWICRIIIEVESQTEYTNQRHRTAKHVLPFQVCEVATPCLSNTQGYLFSSSILIFFLIENPAHTSDRHQWAPGQGTATQSYLHFPSLRLVGIAWTQPTVTVELERQGPGQAQAVHVTCFVCVHCTHLFRQATFQVQGYFWVAPPPTGTYHTPRPVAMLGWAIVRCQSRSQLWTSWQEAGAQRDRRRRSVIKSQVIWLKMLLVFYSHIFLWMFHIHIASALAVRLQCSSHACKKYAEDHGFKTMHALFWIDTEIRTN